MSRGTNIEWDYRGWRFSGYFVGAKSGEGSSTAVGSGIMGGGSSTAVGSSIMGGADRVIVAFHGFDRDAAEMEVFMPLFDDNTAMLSINLLHHGVSQPMPPLPMNEELDPELLLEAIEVQTGDLPMELLGYSMGSRVALTLFQMAPSKFSTIIALAPDGLRKGLLYRTVVNTKVGARIWRLVDKNPKTSKWLINAMRKLRLISHHKHHFARYHTDNADVRAKVENSWASLDRFWPQNDKLIFAIRNAVKKGRNVYFIFGDNDKIIPIKFSQHLQSLLKNDSQGVYFLEVEGGHVMRHPETVEDIRQAILHS